MQGENMNSPSGSQQTYAEAIKEVALSTKDLVQSEIALVTAELKESGKHASQHVTQAVIFGALLAISVLPFLAFLIIGIGELMGDRYWLSSLLVAVACAALGGGIAYRAYVKLRDYDIKMPRTERALSRGANLVEEKVDDVKRAAKGDRYGSQPKPQYT